MDCRTIKKQGVTPIDNWDRYEKNFFLDSHRNWRNINRCRALLKVSSDMHYMIKINQNEKNKKTA